MRIHICCDSNSTQQKYLIAGNKKTLQYIRPFTTKTELLRIHDLSHGVTSNMPVEDFNFKPRQEHLLLNMKDINIK